MVATVRHSFSRRALLGLGESRASVEIGAGCLAFNQVMCESCADACEPCAIQFHRVGAIREPVVYADACTACEACLDVCPVNALKIRHP